MIYQNKDFITNVNTIDRTIDDPPPHAEYNIVDEL